MSDEASTGRGTERPTTADDGDDTKRASAAFDDLGAVDALEAAGIEWDQTQDASGTFEPAERTVSVLRTIADDVRGETPESTQVAAILYRVSDLYDPDEETSPEEIYRNVRHIMATKDAGGLRR